MCSQTKNPKNLICSPIQGKNTMKGKSYETPKMNILLRGWQTTAGFIRWFKKPTLVNKKKIKVLKAIGHTNADTIAVIQTAKWKQHIFR